MAAWCVQHDIEHVFTQPGNPQQNAYVERFNRTVRYECLNQHWFRTLAEASYEIEQWRQHYNHVRPHSSKTLEMNPKKERNLARKKKNSQWNMIEY